MGVKAAEARNLTSARFREVHDEHERSCRHHQYHPVRHLWTRHRSVAWCIIIILRSCQVVERPRCDEDSLNRVELQAGRLDLLLQRHTEIDRFEFVVIVE